MYICVRACPAAIFGSPSGACGAAVIDLELGGASDGGREAINGFEAATSRAGGSAPQAASALADHGVAAVAVAPIAGDAQGDELARLLLDRGVRVDAPPAGEEAEAAAKPASRWAASSIMSLRATLRLVDMFGHKEANVDASAGAVQRAWRKRRQSVNLGAAEGLSEV